MDRERPRITFEIPFDSVRVEAPQPELLTQRNVEAVTGITKRQYLEVMLPAYRAAGGEIARQGHLRIVSRAEFVAWLFRTGQPQKALEGTARTSDLLAEELGIEVA